MKKHANFGSVVSIRGSIVDVQFDEHLPAIQTLLRTGKTGEIAIIRARICEGLGFLGIELDKTRNAATGAVISADAGRVTVRVIPTDEERMIARSLCRILKPERTQRIE